MGYGTKEQYTTFYNSQKEILSAYSLISLETVAYHSHVGQKNPYPLCHPV
jgi:hypothetical protein